jgi:hypothetical protein
MSSRCAYRDSAKAAAFCAPSGDTGEAIGTVAHQSQVVWNGPGLHSELGHDAGLIAQDILPTVQLNDPRAHKALTQIFVRRTNEHSLHTLIASGFAGRRSQRSSASYSTIGHTTTPMASSTFSRTYRSNTNNSLEVGTSSTHRLGEPHTSWP